MFRKMSPPTPFEGLEQINLESDQRNWDRISEQFPNNDIRPSTNGAPKTLIFTRYEKTHPKLYLVKREESNNFVYDIDLSESTPEQLKKGLDQKKRPKHCREGSHCWSSDCTAPTPLLLESRYLDHLRLLD